MRLIDADALIPMMKYASTDSEIGIFPILIGFNAIKKVIDDAPTIEERKTGHWIRSDDRWESGICSCCGWDSGDEWDYCLKNFKYCPNCGNPMEARHEQN